MESNAGKGLQVGLSTGENEDCPSSNGITRHSATLTFTTLCNAAGLPVVADVSAGQSVPGQNLSVVQDSSTVSVSDLMNSVPLSAGLNTAPMQWSSVGGQNAIITLHTLPFMEGGQGITITEAGVSLDPSLVQSLISQTVGVKSEEVSALTIGGSAAGSAVIGQAGPSQVLPSETAVMLESVPLEVPVEITDDTPIFSRVCATLNAHLMNTVPGMQDLLIELNTEEDVTVGVEEDQHFTLETSFHHMVLVHNRLKDLLNLPSITRYAPQTSPIPPPTPPPPPPLPPPKKTENVGVSCQLLVPFVSSKGRSIRLPGNLQGALNDHDYLDSDDADEELRKYSRRRKGSPKKLISASVVFPKMRHTFVSLGEGAAENHVQTEIVNLLQDQTSGDGGETSASLGGEAGAGEDSEDAENIAELSRPQELTILRKTRRIKHETKATHMRRIYEGRIPFKFFCDKCSFKSKRESHFLKHMKHHDIPGTDLHKCSDCDFKTIRLSHLRRHELLHKKSLVKCDFCGYVTDSSQQLLKHVKLKHPYGKDTAPAYLGKPFRCDICGRAFSNQPIFTQHLMKHAQESNTSQAAAPDGSFQCKDCLKTFLRRVHYDRHRRDVHGPQLRPHLCDICGKAFKRTDALQQHKLVHMSSAARVYPFHCSQCNKGFRSQAHLNEHMTMHSTDRPYLCQYCGSAFKTQSVQKKHILSLHLKPRSYACNICDKKFNTRSGLQRHTRIHELDAEKLAAQSAAAAGTLIELDITDAEQLQRHTDAAAVVTVEDAAEVLQTQQQPLVQDVLSGSIEESLEQGEVLQPQYIQGSETATALFYLTGSL